ncbi:MAG: hypothetical protein IJO19_01690 [Clostridia bacterium]|nr:hypothetical protein [Clostridia bacterium]
MRKFIPLILSISLLISTFSFYQIIASASTFEEINQSEVFIKQQPKTCTLASSVMMVRRASILCGKTNWKSITEDSMRSTAWINGLGLSWEFTYNGISVGHNDLPSTNKKNCLINLLTSHPEGIVAYNYGNSSQYHAIILTDYTDGMFYCADPAGSTVGRVPLTSSTIKGSGQDGKIANFNYYWYVTSPSFSTNGDYHLHKTVLKNYKEATYFENGYSGDMVCSICNEIIQKGTVTNKLSLKTPSVKYSTAKKKIKVTYKKVKNATGFQVKCVNTANGNSYAKKYNTTKTVTKSITSLRGKSYKVKIRSYTKNKNTGKIAYSSWTKNKKLTVK